MASAPCSVAWLFWWHRRFSLWPLTHRFLAKAIQLFIDLLEATTAVDAKYDDCISTVLAVEDVHSGSRQRAVGLLHRQRHRKGNLQHLIAAWMACTGKNLLAKGLVEVGHTHHAGALQPLLLQQLL